MDDLRVFDVESATVHEKATIMCISRIDDLERRLHNMELRLESERLADEKSSLVNVIASCDDRAQIYVDVFSFLLGMSAKDRVRRRDSPVVFLVWHVSSTKNDALIVVPARATELHRHIDAHPPLWEFRHARDDYDLLLAWTSTLGTGMYDVLSDMTLSELRGYWRWRLAHTRWTSKE